MALSKLAQVSRYELVKLYQENGWTTQQIGQHFGVSGETVRVQLARLDIPRRGKPWSSTEARAQLSSERLQQLYVMDGLSLAAIGKKLGVGETTDWEYLRKYGI